MSSSFICKNQFKIHSFAELDDICKHCKEQILSEKELEDIIWECQKSQERYDAKSIAKTIYDKSLGRLKQKGG